MTNRLYRRRMQVLRIREDRAFLDQAFESAITEQIRKPFEIVVTELVDDNSDNQLRW